VQREAKAVHQGNVTHPYPVPTMRLALTLLPPSVDSPPPAHLRPQQPPPAVPTAPCPAALPAPPLTAFLPRGQGVGCTGRCATDSISTNICSCLYSFFLYSFVVTGIMYSE
jgi:hypothetical protein